MTNQRGVECTHHGAIRIGLREIVACIHNKAKVNDSDDDDAGGGGGDGEQLLQRQQKDKREQKKKKDGIHWPHEKQPCAGPSYGEYIPISPTLVQLRAVTEGGSNC